MIPKIVCFIFGHKIREKAYTGEYDDGYRAIDPFARPAALYTWKYWSICPRCGTSLKVTSPYSRDNDGTEEADQA